MTPQHDFTARRALAQHCAELLPATPPARDLASDCAELASRIASELGRHLGAICGGADLTLAAGEVGRTNTTAFINRLGRKAAHWVTHISGGAALLMSLDHAAALALTDRAYGGTGEVPEALPETLPLSADLTVRQLEAACRDGLERVFASSGADVPALSRRGTDLGQLDPFRGKAECIHFDLTVTAEEQASWTIVVAASLTDMQAMIDCTQLAAGGGQSGVSADAIFHDPLGEPFGDIALPAVAVIAELTLPLARLAALTPGDLIPLSIARQVPLHIGGVPLAWGSVGAQDDRVALKITRISENLPKGINT
ncbi:FliM/FliN family flagellar motor C-terminal domain-containing protein [Allopontixanthobacter sediminis]|uniref:Flagellar motor switch protein FliN-like C-terminal domain-containing protein n=1 Tax=Allopontixanthobacter sediminis TaxID=1689985 RepID=A0A845B3L3_9SPHN|nr:hypothetical protein [Allopontixanthobacter sediminis]